MQQGRSTRHSTQVAAATITHGQGAGRTISHSRERLASSSHWGRGCTSRGGEHREVFVFERMRILHHNRKLQGDCLILNVNMNAHLLNLDLGVCISLNLYFLLYFFLGYFWHNGNGEDGRLEEKKDVFSY